VSWVDAVYDTDHQDVRETALAPGARVHVDDWIITNRSGHTLDVAVWVNPQQRHIKVWDPTGRSKESIEVNLTADDMTGERGALRVDQMYRPG
jgi:hypothetical protein